MFPHCGSFSIGPCRPLPHAKLRGINLKIGTCRGNFSINSHGNQCLMTVAYSILSRIQQAMSFFVRSLEPQEGIYLRHSTARPKFYTASAYLQVSTTEFDMGSPRSDTKRNTMRKHWQTDWINFELWEPIGLATNSKKYAAVFNFPDYITSHSVVELGLNLPHARNVWEEMSQCEGGLSLAILIRVIATQSKATTQIILYRCIVESYRKWVYVVKRFTELWSICDI